MKIADGGGTHVERRRGASKLHLDLDARMLTAFSAIRLRRCSSRSNATARQPGPLRHHSIAMLPDPAPTSHSSSPGRGASAASVTARIDCLVICPSWANASSGSTDEPAVVGQVAHGDHVEVVDVAGRSRRPLACGGRPAALGRPAELFEHGDLANRRGRCR